MTDHGLAGQDDAETQYDDSRDEWDRLAEPPETDARLHPVDAVSRRDEDQADAAHHRGHPETEGDDKDEPERRPSRRDGTEQDQSALVDGMRPPASPSDEQAAPRDAGPRHVRMRMRV